MTMATRRKRLIFSLTAIFLGIAIPVLALEVLLRFLPVRTPLGTVVVNERNPIIHFTPNQAFTYSQGWRFSMVNTGRINNYGFVNQKDYLRQEDQGPVVIVGDSYVEAMMVPYEQTVHGQLDELGAKNGHVYSLGISGAQLPQYLAFAQYAWQEFAPRAMVFVIIGNDFDESMAKYRDWPGFHYFEEDSVSHALKLVRKDYRPSLTKRLIRHSALIRYLWDNIGVENLATFLTRMFDSADSYVGNTAASAPAERVADSRRAVNAFFSELPRRVGLDKSRVLFVVDAMRPQIYSGGDLVRAEESYVGQMRRYFLDTAERNGYEAIDMQPRFRALHNQNGMRFEYPTDHHWNELGHQEAAHAIASSKAFRTP